jgi:hypothetical protein
MNTALFETNATIEVSDPVRMQDGVQYNWFTSFTSNTFNLEAAETTSVSLSVVHGESPPPGLYSMMVTGTDIDNSVSSELEIFFDVPVLAGADIVMPGEQFIVSPLEPTELQILVFNEGNGAQTYDVELISPAGWHLGLDTLGAFAGSSHGSTGTMARDAGRTIDITINPPGAMIPAGSVFDAAIIIHSRVSSDSWSEDIPLVVKAIDEVSTTPSSDGAEHDIVADALLELEVELSNLGNRMLDLQPYMRNIPGGWTVSGGLDTISIPAGESGVWSVALQGNGVAVSGDIKLRFATDDGFYVDWNRTLNVLSGAIPTLSFHMVALPDGTVSDYPLGVGAHPVGGFGFDLSWNVTNQGSTTWHPTTYLEVPDDDWSWECPLVPSTLPSDTSFTVWCQVVIPLSAEASSEPIVTLVMEGEGVEVSDSISLLVESVARVSWTLTNQPTAHEGYSATLYIELENTGNSDLSYVLQASGPEGWNPLILDGVVVNLRPGEVRSLNLGFTPDSGNDGTLVVELAGAGDVEGSSFSIEIDVLPAAKVQGTSILETLLIAVLVLALVGGGLYVYSRRGGDSSSLIQSDTLTKIADSFGLGEQQEEESDGIPCWICSQNITLGEAWACLECGARYHRSGQVQGCDIVSMGNCLHCDAPSEELAEA